MSDGVILIDPFGKTVLDNQDKVHDKFTDFVVRVSDQSFIVMVCEGEFTVSHQVLSINQGECLIACLLRSTERILFSPFFEISPVVF